MAKQIGFIDEISWFLEKFPKMFIPVIPGNSLSFPGMAGNENFREIPGNPGNGIPGNQPYAPTLNTIWAVLSTNPQKRVS